MRSPGAIRETRVIRVTRFEYMSLDGPVFYFIVLDDSGTPHVAIDACENCYAYKRGYRQEGSRMICNNCGTSVTVDDVGVHDGGCNPGVVDYELTSDAVLIEPEEFESSSWYFH